MHVFKLTANSNSGRFTLEASIIMPVVVSIVIALAYAGLYLYQKEAIQRCASETAEKSAASWYRDSFDLDTIAYTRVSGSNLYARLFDNNEDAKREAAALYAKKSIQRKTVLKSVSEKVTVSVGNSFLSKKITVSIECRYPIPFKGLLSIFGVKDYVLLKGEAVAIVTEPPELIRNVDFVIEIEKDLEKKFPEIKKLREKLTVTIKDTIKGIIPD